ncbi:MAG: Uma2 family endonuclease [Firmicutes bacterium]|nr:Uma2 family endonuclease [Bacillota bacterium]
MGVPQSPRPDPRPLALGNVPATRAGRESEDARQGRPGSGSPPVTYTEYAALDDARRYQVFSGLLVAEPAPSPGHQRVVGNLLRILTDHIEKAGVGGVLLLSPVDVVLDADGPQIEILQPDLLWIRAERAAIVQETAVFGAPDLAVEVLSPSSAWRDRQEKVRRYREFGVPHIWLVDPRSRVFEELPPAEPGGSPLVHHGREVFRPRCFPQLSLEPAAVWPGESGCTTSRAGV